MRTRDRVVVLATERRGVIVGWQRNGWAVVHLDGGEGVEPFHAQELEVTKHFEPEMLDVLQSFVGHASGDFDGCVD